MRDFIKKCIRDTRLEPYVRWLVKRSRGIRMPFGLVKNEIYDRQAFEVLERVLEPHSNCVDVGCHQGLFLEKFLHYSYLGHHFAFEPIPDLAEQLQEKFPAVEVYPYALSNRSGAAVFYHIPDAPALSGLHAREFVAHEKVRQEITVRMERLDDVIPRDIKINLIKIDVEGAEGPVIMGAMDIIKRNQPYVLLEHGDESSRAFGFSSEAIYDLLVVQCDLKLSLLKNWLHREAPLTKQEFLNSKDWYFIAYRG